MKNKMYICMTFLDEWGAVHEKPADRSVEWRISAYALICSPEGKMLLVQPTWNTKWELPGGGIELGETISAAIARECYEETGYTVATEPMPIAIGERNFYSKLSDQYFQALILVYRGALVNETQHPEVINTIELNEISRVEWVDPVSLNEFNVHPIAWPAIQQYQQYQLRVHSFSTSASVKT